MIYVVGDGCRHEMRLQTQYVVMAADTIYVVMAVDTIYVVMAADTIYVVVAADRICGDGCRHDMYKDVKQGNSVARDLPPTGSEANTTICAIYICDIPWYRGPAGILYH